MGANSPRMLLPGERPPPPPTFKEMAKSKFNEHPYLYGAAGAVAGLVILRGMFRGPRVKAAETVLPGGLKASGWGRKFYEGGFEPEMTKREAAKILGCREHATKEKIMERYRTMIVLNHPDQGGSPYLTAKINQAKSMLLDQARSAKDR